MRIPLRLALALAAGFLVLPRAIGSSPAPAWTVGVVAETGARGEILPCT